MCGIAGFIISPSKEEGATTLKRMTDVIAHRGPDGEGQWSNGAGIVNLGHRRLSIIDLSNAGAQPMHYLERYTIVFNGEIYNYIELRTQCLAKGYKFESGTDTEVIMALYDWKGKDCLEAMDGMFAFALYDAQTARLFCARDRFGEKPFFYSYKKGDHFYFGSEMKCLWAAGIPKEVNARMEFNYLNYGYLENPSDVSETFFNNCTRLPHAHYLVLDTAACCIIEQQQYYSISWQGETQQISEAAAIEQFRELMTTSVARRLRSDVKVGSSLSGGLDSSVVVSIINELSAGNLHRPNTFSAVFPGWKKDERAFIDAIVAKNHVHPHFVMPTGEGMAADFDKLAWHQEEPFGSASIYAQYCVMRLANETGVTVLLDGQGADEVLAGYPGYFEIYYKELQRRRNGVYEQQKAAYDSLYGESGKMYYDPGGLRNRIERVSPALTKTLRKAKHLVAPPDNPALSKEYVRSFSKEDSFLRYGDGDTLNAMLYSHTHTSGALQQLLRYADRNSMAHSREVRLPFLSHLLVDFAFSLPPEMKINKGWTKWILREAFSELLPQEIAWRKEKVGFEPPQQDWLSQPAISDKMKAAKTRLNARGVLAKNNTPVQGHKEQWRYLQVSQLATTE